MISFEYAQDVVEDWTTDAWDDLTMDVVNPQDPVDQWQYVRNEELVRTVGPTRFDVWKDCAASFIDFNWNRLSDGCRERMQSHPDWEGPYRSCERRNRRGTTTAS